MFRPIPESASVVPTPYVLQSWLLPELGLAPASTLFFHTSGGVGFSLKNQCFDCIAGAEIRLDGWGNLFNLAKWSDTFVSDIELRIEGAGRFEVSVVLQRPETSDELLFCETIALDRGGVIDLSDGLAVENAGILVVALRCLDPIGRVSNLVWVTQSPPNCRPDVCVVIPTFHREDSVSRTVQRLLSLRDDARLCGTLSLCVIDNGRSVALPDHPALSVVPSDNFGGSGGFARGLMQARSRGASHCLFMDDDAEVHLESFRRALAYIAYTKEGDQALVGAMIATENRDQLWENGATFHAFCKPIGGGTRLDLAKEVAALELSAPMALPDTGYGGWWFFLFPVACAHHLPFPFFLRGDDVSFALANHFKLSTLNGVFAYQQGFTEKETPRSWYFDIRSHLLHHLSLPQMQVSVFVLLKIVLLFLGQTVVRMHYAGGQAVLLGFSDVLQGPEFFARNAQMQQRSNDLSNLCQQENWEPCQLPVPPSRQARFSWIWKAMGNGIILPFFSTWARHVVIRAKDRRNLNLIWGAARVTVQDPTGRLSYDVHHSKTRALGLGVRFAILSVRFLWRFHRLRRDYQNSYSALTSTEFWAQQFAEAEATA